MIHKNTTWKIYTCQSSAAIPKRLIAIAIKPQFSDFLVEVTMHFGLFGVAEAVVVEERAACSRQARKIGLRMASFPQPFPSQDHHSNKACGMASIAAVPHLSVPAFMQSLARKPTPAQTSNPEKTWKPRAARRPQQKQVQAAVKDAAVKDAASSARQRGRQMSSPSGLAQECMLKSTLAAISAIQATHIAGLEALKTNGLSVSSSRRAVMVVNDDRFEDADVDGRFDDADEEDELEIEQVVVSGTPMNKRKGVERAVHAEEVADDPAEVNATQYAPGLEDAQNGQELRASVPTDPPLDDEEAIPETSQVLVV